MRPGRLFWKFFLFLWAAQLVTAVGVGAGMWLMHPQGRFGSPPGGPPPAALSAPMPLPPDRVPGAGGPVEFVPPPRDGEPSFWQRPPFLPLFAGSLVSVLMAAALAWYFSRPIQVLRAAFERAAAGDLAARVGGAMAQRRDELADLGRDFDHMAERLQGLVDAQRRLLHDVSHELRSPLARLQATSDLLTQQPERAAEFIARIERETVRMDHLVGELLTLARLDAGLAGTCSDNVDLIDLIDEVAEDARFEGQPRGCTVNVDIANQGLVPGNRELLHRALENVVRNALRHSPEGGRVDIALSRERTGGQVLIQVSDQGPGVPEADLARIFEPFLRSEGADSFAGYGLGLAITRRVMGAPGGTVLVANQAGGGLQVELRLPG